MNVSEMQIIRGYVQALPPDSGKEQAARVAVVTDDGVEYLVRHKGEGTSLLANVNANVEVMGNVSPLSRNDDDDEDRKGYLLTVVSYRLTDGFDDPWYDDTVR